MAGGGSGVHISSSESAGTHGVVERKCSDGDKISSVLTVTE